jgi:hypothetical protein
MTDLDLNDPSIRKSWELDTNEPIRGGILDGTGNSTDLRFYELEEREALAREGRSWREQQLCHDPVMRADYKPNSIPGRTPEWLSMREIHPTVCEHENTREQPLYPDDDMSQIYALIKEKLGNRAPTQKNLKLLLRIAFFASLTREEGRELTFVIGYCEAPRSDERNEQGRFVFDNPLPLNVRQLTKLAPACNTIQGIIGIHAGTNDRLEIWGLLNNGSSQWRLRQGKSTSCSSFSMVSVRVNGPGDLCLEVGPERIVRFHDGVKTNDGLPVLFEDGPILRRLLLHKVELATQWLVRGVLEMRHGGTIFLIPPATRLIPGQSSTRTVKRIDDLCEIKYRFDKYVDLIPKRLSRCLDYQQAQSEREKRSIEGDPSFSLSAAQLGSPPPGELEARIELEDAVEMVFGLTAVDGALILTTNLEVIGFGAVVKEIHDAPPIYKSIDVRGEQLETFDLKGLGTRHRSAACFCYKYPGTLAFVASQDGALSCMTTRPNVPGHEHAVVVWRPVATDRNIPAPPP